MRLPIRRTTLERAEAALIVLGAALLTAVAVVRAPVAGALVGTLDNLILVTAALSLIVGWRSRRSRAPAVQNDPSELVPAGVAQTVTAAVLLALCVFLRVFAPASALLAVVVAPLTLVLAPGLTLAPLLPARGRGERLVLASVSSLALQLVAVLWLDLAGVRTTPAVLFTLCAAICLLGALASLAGPRVPWLDARFAQTPPGVNPWHAMVRVVRDRAQAGHLRWSTVPWLCFLFVAVLTTRWAALDRPFYFWDPFFHMGVAVDLLRDPWAVLAETAPEYANVYPPLGHAVLAVVFWLTRYDLDATRVLYNLLFLALLFAATYRLGRELFSVRAGALAVLCLTAYPEVFVHARWPLLDLPLAACVAATVYALLRSRDFADRRWSLLFGLCLGAGQMIKHLQLPLVLLPTLLALWNAARARRWKNPVLGLAVAAVLVLPWWLPRLSTFLGPYREFQRAAVFKHGTVGTLSTLGLSFYSLGLWYVISLAFALLWLLALPAFLRRPGRGTILLWGVGMYAVLTLVPLKITRYSAPLLPAVAIMTGAGLDRWRRAPAVAMAAAIFGAVQAWAMSFGLPWLPEGRNPNAVTLAEPFVPFAQHTHMELGFWPDSGGWGLAEPLAAYRGRIAVLDPYPGARENRYRFAFLREGVELQHFPDRAQGRSRARLQPVTCEDVARFGTFDHVFVPMGPPGSWLQPDRDAERCLQQLRLVARVPLRRGPGRLDSDFMSVSEVGIYEPRAQPRSLAPPTKWIAPVAPDAAVTIEDLNPRMTQAQLEGVLITVRNRTRQAQTIRFSYALAEMGRDPWKHALFRAPESLLSLPPGHTATMEFVGPGALARGEHLVAAYLHWIEPVTGQELPSHHANLVVRLGAQVSDGR